MSVSHPRAGARRARIVPLVLAGALVAGAGALPAQAAVVQPRLQLLAPEDDVTLYKYGRRDRVGLQLGLYVAALDAPFELQARRPDYMQPPVLTQVLHGAAGETQVVDLDETMMAGWAGLDDFFEVTFTDETGATVVSKSIDFCPGGYLRERVDDTGPDQPRYPSGCFANPFTKGAIWGIDRSWAVGLDGYEAPRVRVADGSYEVAVSIAPAYVDAFSIAPEDASAQLHVTVTREGGVSCPPICGGPKPRPPMLRRLAVPTIDPPEPATLPDLVPLPSWGIRLENGRKRSVVSFGATVWTAGASDLVVEGFRREGEATMDAYQYFYENGSVTGKARVGELEYDDRDGHAHWHFKQFAAYSLLDADLNEVRTSGKEAFCLASTDAIDLTLPGVDLNPTIGLSTACGSPSSIWVREILPLGWGDTYFQGLPGQSFNVTDLPNGKYFIRVEANPGDLLHEQSHENNVELREIRLKGPAGDRRVVVPPWNGIDSEADLGFLF
ncbi:MAG TPA: lysyl oxidase family protein [Actinomycetota bacterium]|nr:lysyl oxidase family protein [Actinomycetota bacterium]